MTEMSNSVCTEKALGFYQKYFNLCSEDEGLKGFERHESFWVNYLFKIICVFRIKLWFLLQSISVLFEVSTFWWNKLSTKGHKSFRFRNFFLFVSLRKVNKSEPLNNFACMLKGVEVKRCGTKYPPKVNLQCIDSLM